MAEFLRTAGISHQIEEIIVKAKEKLVIVSPYLKLTDNLLERLSEKDSKNIEMILVYGKSDLNEFERRKLYNLKNLSLYFYKNLHAKCYFNESKMLITSMNLHEFSAINNREMGVFIDKTIDSHIYEDAVLESLSIIKAADLEKKAKSSTSNEKKFDDFEFSYEGDFSKWTNQLHALLSEKYPALKFINSQRKYLITCNPFLNECIELQIEPERTLLRIVFQFLGNDRYKVYNFVLANGRHVLEKSYPVGVVNWGSQMKRLKLDFTQERASSIIKFDKGSLIETIKLIEQGASTIIGILNDYKG